MIQQEGIFLFACSSCDMGDKEGASWRVSSKLMVLQQFPQTSAVLTRGLVSENVPCKRDEGSIGTEQLEYAVFF
jgi:hypothetical protein